MIQMLPKLHIPVPPRRDVEIALHLIPLQAAINPTRPPLPPYPRRLRKLPSPLPQRQHVVHVLFLLGLARRRTTAMQPMHALGVDPLLPVRGVAPQQIAGEDAVARGVLHVEVQVRTAHGDDDVEVDLQVVRDALLDAEVVRLVALPPAVQLREGEEQADGEEEGGDLAAAAGGERVGRFGFSCFSGLALGCAADCRGDKGEGGEKSVEESIYSSQTYSRFLLHLRNASKVLNPSVKVFFSPNALSSSR